MQARYVCRQQLEANRLSERRATPVENSDAKMNGVRRQADDQMSDAGSEASSQAFEANAGPEEKQPALWLFQWMP